MKERGWKETVQTRLAEFGSAAHGRKTSNHEQHSTVFDLSPHGEAREMSGESSEVEFHRQLTDVYIR
jgi:hypothetical protein